MCVKKASNLTFFCCAAVSTFAAMGASTSLNFASWVFRQKA